MWIPAAVTADGNLRSYLVEPKPDEHHLNNRSGRIMVIFTLRDLVLSISFCVCRFSDQNQQILHGLGFLRWMVWVQQILRCLFVDLYGIFVDEIIYM